VVACASPAQRTTLETKTIANDVKKVWLLISSILADRVNKKV
jgi:hypothetical protein